MSYRDRFAKVLSSILAILSGILLFAAAAAALLNSGLFNADLHMSLFEKYGIYAQLEKTADNALQNYIGSLKSGPVENEKQKDELLSLMESAVTPDMIRLNADNLVNGLSDYFSGRMRFLPDVYLRPSESKTSQPSQEDMPQPAFLSEQALGTIDSINLGVVLTCMGRDDVINMFAEGRLLYFGLSHAPVFLLLVSLLLVVLALLLTRKTALRLCLGRVMAVSGITAIAAGGLALVLGRLLLPGYLSSSFAVRYVSEASLNGYIQGIMNRPAAWLTVFGAVMLAVTRALRLPPGRILPKLIRRLSLNGQPKYGKAAIGMVLSVLLCLALFVDVKAADVDFHAKELGTALQRIESTTSGTGVVFARDSTIKPS